MILYWGGLDRIINACKGHDEQVSLEVTESWVEGRCRVKGLKFLIISKMIVRVIGILNEGIMVKR